MLETAILPAANCLLKYKNKAAKAVLAIITP